MTNCPGTSVSFSVSATGTGLSYQWYKGTTALAGQTGSSLVLSNVSAADAATYSVVVSGTCGNAVSNSASLTVNQNVVVSQRAGQRDQLSGDDGELQRERDGDGPELSVV